MTPRLDSSKRAVAAPRESPPVRLKEVANVAAAQLAQVPGTDDDKLAAVSAAADVFQREAVTQRLLANRPPAPHLAPVQPLRARNLLLAAAAGALAMLVVVATIFVLFVMGQLPLPGPWQGQASNYSDRTAAVGEPTPASQITSVTPRLVVAGSTGVRGEPVPLGVTLQGRADDAVVVVMGLAPGMSLSAGRAAGAGSWEIAAADLPNAWIGPPLEFVGALEVIAELRVVGTMADRRAIPLEWRAPPERDAMAASAGQVSALPPKGLPVQRQLDRDEVAVLLRRGKEFFANGDLPAARVVLRRAAEAGDAEAALSLAATYDPVVLRELKVLGFAADVATARAWYEKARDLGSAKAARRLEILAEAAR